MSSSLGATQWWPGVADWGSGMYCWVHHGGPIVRWQDGHRMHCDIISPCQSAATSEIVKHFWS